MCLDVDELRRQYRDALPALEEAEQRLTERIKNVIGNIPNKGLVRARIANTRIKEFPSVRAKAERHSWPPENAIHLTPDIVGARIVCSTQRDANRFVELLREELRGMWEEADVQDYADDPQDSGYRAVHINFQLGVGAPRTRFGCEVQVRTLIQEAWAELTHKDIYKEGDELPETLHGLSRRLAELLETCDGIAQDVRDQVMSARTPPDEEPDLTTVSEDGLAYIFATVFGRPPANWAVRKAAEIAAQRALTSLESLHRELENEEHRNELRRAYGEESGWTLDNEDIFIFSAVAAAESRDRGVEYAREQGRRGREEIEAQWSSEVLAELPESLPEFTGFLSRPDFDVGYLYSLAEAFGALRHCSICSTGIVLSDGLAQNLCEHYDEEEIPDGLEGAILNSGVETGDHDDWSLCFVCGDRLRD